MRPRKSILGSASSPTQPRRLGSLVNQTFVSLAQSTEAFQSTSAFASTGHHGGRPELTTTYAPDEADDEGEGSSYDLDADEDEDDIYLEDDEDDEEDLGSDDYLDDDPDEHSRNQGAPCYVDPYSFPVHNHPPRPSNVPPHPDLYLSEESDLSDDAGTPLVNHYSDVLNLLSHDMDIESASDTDAGIEYSSHEEDFVLEANQPGTTDGPEASPQGNADVFHDAQPSVAPAMVDFMTGATLHPSPPPPVPNPPLTHHSMTTWFDGTHPTALSNPNPATLGPSNYGLTDFLHNWARQTNMLQGLVRGRAPWPAQINELAASETKCVKRDDLHGDLCDFQGIDWVDLRVQRTDARERRLLTYNNYVNIPGSDKWTPDLPDVMLPKTRSFFRFRRMDIRRNVHLAHFQLRYLLGSASRSRVFYPSVNSIQQLNPISGESRSVVKLSNIPGSQISTLIADHGVLVAGNFNGEYILRHLDSDEPESRACHIGTITTHLSGITNHVQVHPSRSSSAPLAAFASNDMIFRTMDIATETWLSHEEFDFPLNCTALSPDKRLRVMVGDTLKVTIIAAESTLPGGKPEVLRELSGHHDYGFACDWADDGWTIATAFQDKSVKIWDARYLTDMTGAAVPLCTIRTQMAGARNLKFSPVGSGKRVLVAAEEADYINIIDAQTFRSKQTLDIFGEIGGVGFANGGQDLQVLCCDRDRGGLLQFERCNLGGEATFELADDSDNDKPVRLGEHPLRHHRGGGYDWPESVFTEDRRWKESKTKRQRKAAGQVDLEPF
ncbi:WD40-repeat-containing domain protein [Triangularia verruculosa]|uniref:WD40-repeat-containing domain protein n=1 Tax=Triangularia verruculosa TaxID=2587418 RepID=A0AAN6XDY2_9PEZI|nr:WD40-repeat-containing domain protein [Triangularia verruculosa]